MSTNKELDQRDSLRDEDISGGGDNGTQYYEGDSGEAYHLAVHGQEIESPGVFRAKAELARYRYFRDLSPDARVFEFGTGAGFNLKLIIAHEVAGFDISETARRLTRDQGIDVLEEMGTVPNHHYDVVLCRHVLEHVPTPVEILQSLATKIAPGGRLLLVLPVEHGWRHQRGFVHDDVNQHLYSWKLQHVANLLGVCGLEIDRFTYNWYSAQRLFRWMPRVVGVRAFDMAVTVAGFIRRQSEMVISARVAGDVR